VKINLLSVANEGDVQPYVQTVLASAKAQPISIKYYFPVAYNELIAYE